MSAYINVVLDSMKSVIIDGGDGSRLMTYRKWKISTMTPTKKQRSPLGRKANCRKGIDTLLSPIKYLFGDDCQEVSKIASGLCRYAHCNFDP